MNIIVKSERNLKMPIRPLSSTSVSSKCLHMINTAKIVATAVVHGAEIMYPPNRIIKSPGLKHLVTSWLYGDRVAAYRRVNHSRDFEGRAEVLLAIRERVPRPLQVAFAELVTSLDRLRVKPLPLIPRQLVKKLVGFPTKATIKIADYSDTSIATGAKSFSRTACN